MPATLESPRSRKSSRPAAALRKALLLGAALLSAPSFAAPQGAASMDPPDFAQAPATKKTRQAKADPSGEKAGRKPAAAAKSGGKAAAGKHAGKQKPGPLADFGQEAAPPDVVHVANWVSYTRNNQKKAFVIIDKKMARLYVFDRQGRLKSHTPVLLGKAVGDHSVPGIGNKPLSQIREEEKTTPAGRFRAEPGRNTRGDDIIWIDYDAAVSMHRLRKVAAEERRAQRLATPDESDNRISNGCVNVPPRFYDSVLKPTVTRQGAFVYVLPETMSPQQRFGSFEVADKDGRVQADEATGESRRKGGS